MQVSYSASVDIPVLPKLPNSLGQFNKWARYNEQKKWMTIISRSFVGMLPAEPLLKAIITITRYSAREPDTDNLYASLKPVLDGLVRNAILADDNPDNILLEAKWKRGVVRGGRIEIEITEGI